MATDQTSPMSYREVERQQGQEIDEHDVGVNRRGEGRPQPHQLKVARPRPTATDRQVESERVQGTGEGVVVVRAAQA